MSETAERKGTYIRLDRKLFRTIDHLAVEWELDRARTIERLVRLGLSTVDVPWGEP